MKRKLHLLKLKLLKIKWYFDVLYSAHLHAKEVENYAFLTKLRNKANGRLLELDRTDPDNTDIQKLEIQIELLDKIINYTK